MVVSNSGQSSALGRAINLSSRAYRMANTAWRESIRPSARSKLGKLLTCLGVLTFLSTWLTLLLMLSAASGLGWVCIQICEVLDLLAQRSKHSMTRLKDSLRKRL